MSMELTVRETVEKLNGRQKAAVICMVMGAETAAEITQRLQPDEVEAISYEIARMNHVNSEVVDAVLLEWTETLRATELIALGGEQYAQEVLEKAFGSDRAKSIFKRIQSHLSESAGLSRLRGVDPQQLGSMLRSEHPQTIAVVLGHLEPAHTAMVLREIGPATGVEVIYRLARMEKVSPDVLETIGQALGSETDLSLSQGMSVLGGPEAVAQVLNLITPSLEKELLESLMAQDPDLCEQIKNLMFVFEDIASLDDLTIQRILREVEAKDLALALKGASGELEAKIKGLMSRRAVEALEEKMEMMGPVRVRDVEAAQLAIVARIRQLEDEGEVVITSGGADEVIH